MHDPSHFESVARQYSNCPSAQVGGSLGALARGEVVPELEQAIFNGTWLGIHPQLQLAAGAQISGADLGSCLGEPPP